MSKRVTLHLTPLLSRSTSWQQEHGPTSRPRAIQFARHCPPALATSQTSQSFRIQASETPTTDRHSASSRAQADCQLFEALPEASYYPPRYQENPGTSQLPVDQHSTEPEALKFRSATNNCLRSQGGSPGAGSILDLASTSPLVGFSGPRSISAPVGHASMDSPTQAWASSTFEMSLGMQTSDIASPAEHGSPLAALVMGEEATEDLPYAQLIFHALMSVPDRQMVLKDIYNWFEKYTMKPQRCPNGKQGWRNSIRHNLSMNHAFQKIEPVALGSKDDGKKCFIWRLSDEAQKTGKVMSTTRYRKSVNKKRRSSDEVLRTRPDSIHRISKRSPGVVQLRSESTPSPRMAFMGALVGDPNSGGRQVAAEDLHHRNFQTGSPYQHGDSFYVSFDNSFQYKSLDGTLTPASTMSTAAVSILPEPPTVNAAYSPDIKFESFDSTEFESSYDAGHAASLFDDLTSYKPQQQDVDNKLEPDQSEFESCKQHANGLTSAAEMNAMTAPEPATCSMADLRLPTSDHFGFATSYDLTSGYHGHFL